MDETRRISFTKEQKEFNSKLANAYWCIIVMYKGVEKFRESFYPKASSINLSGNDELVINYPDREDFEKIPMYYSRIHMQMNEFIIRHIKKIEWK